MIALAVAFAVTPVGSDGEVMVREMREQVKLVEMAGTLIRLSGLKDIDINYDGPRPGEKIGEDLFSVHEDRRSTTNPLITRVGVPSLSTDKDWSIERPSHQTAAGWMRQQSARSGF